MDWYAIQVITGKEPQVISALKDFGIEVLLPYRPMFLRHSSNIMRVDRPLMPGYVIARLEVTDFYLYQRNQRVEKMMIRICGNGYDAVPLNEEEITFFKYCCDRMMPLKIKKRIENEVLTGYNIVNSPPWVKNIKVDWYDIDKFKAQICISTSGVIKDHAFTIASYDINDYGSYAEQLQGLSQEGFGKFGRSMRQAVTV